MKAIFKKVILKIHLWLGMLSGIVLFVVAITGCIYVFSEEIKSFVYKDRREITVPENSQRLPISTLLKNAEAAIHHEHPCQSILISSENNHTSAFTFRVMNEEKFGYHNYMEFHKTVFVHPYTGEIVKVENTKWEFFTVVFWLHTTILMGHNDISHHIIVWTMWIFVVSFLSGLVLWWPGKNQFKQSVSFQWKKTTRWRRKNYDLHKILGFYTLPIALILILTGLMWASEDFNKAVKWMANGGKTITEAEFPKLPEYPAAHSPLDSVLSQTKALMPNYKWIFIRIPPIPERPYTVRAHHDDKINYTRIAYYFDQQSAQLISTETFAEKNTGDKIQALNYDIHVGSIGGYPTKILALISCLIIAFLPITGFMLWWGRKNKSHTRKLSVR